MTGLLALFLPGARADIIIGGEDWNDGTLAGWSETQSWVSVSNPNAGGVDGTGYLDIRLEASPGQWFALPSTPATNLFAGAWDEQRPMVEFQFLASNAAPDRVEVRWSSSTNEAVWRNRVFDADKDNMSTQTWTRLGGASLSDWEAWDYGGGTLDAFLADLSAVDWVGVYVYNTSEGIYHYGLDDLNLVVPEPSQFLMLGTALITSAASLRRRRKRRAGRDGPRRGGT